MKKTKLALLCAAVCAFGLIACDAEPPGKTAVSQPLAPEEVEPGETISHVVRDALAEILRDKDPLSRAKRLGTLLPTLGSESVAVVEPTVEDMQFDLEATDLELLMRYWATYEPEDASNWAKSRSNPIFRVAAIYAALKTWAEMDPQAAVDAAWQWGEENPALADVVPLALVRGWYASGGIEGLWEFIRSTGTGVGQKRTIAAYIRAMIQSEGPEAAMRWAESTPDDDAYKRTIYRQLASALPYFDVESAIRWCDAHCDGPLGDGLRSRIGQNWLRREGPAALAWLSTAPESHDNDLATRMTFQEWVQLDSDTAMAWMASELASQSPGVEPARWLLPILPVYTRYLAPEAPAEAIEWAAWIKDEEDREFVRIACVRLWREEDEAAAEAWLLQSPLSEEAREKARVPPNW